MWSPATAQRASGYCLSITGVYAPSQPWSGFALLLLSVGMIRGVRNRERSSASQFSIVYMALVVRAVFFWTVSAIVRG